MSFALKASNASGNSGIGHQGHHFVGGADKRRAHHANLLESATTITCSPDEPWRETAASSGSDGRYATLRVYAQRR